MITEFFFRETRQLSKRAFDRLDMSAFDFGSLSKRYYGDDDDIDEYSRNKKAFDRIDESNFGFGLKKRAFDRLENSAFDFGGKHSETGKNFGLGKNDGIFEFFI